MPPKKKTFGDSKIHGLPVTTLLHVPVMAVQLFGFRNRGRVGRRTRAYHLKVPPSPMPPQPPRGGTQRRILLTPRGVNRLYGALTTALSLLPSWIVEYVSGMLLMVA